MADLDTERVIEMIVKAEKLDESSQLYVNGDNFDFMFTTDFKWANDGAICFFYTRKHKTYSAQLRMFHDENKYFITDSSEWFEQGQSSKLFHYLDALKYIPQEEIILTPLSIRVEGTIQCDDSTYSQVSTVIDGIIF